MKSLLGITLSLAVAQTFAGSCVPGQWKQPPSSQVDPVLDKFPVYAESEHFQLRWPPEKPNLFSKERAQQSLDRFEDIWRFFMNSPVNWPEPFCDTSEKYKVQIFTDEGWGLSGAGIGDRTPAMWVGHTAIPYDVWGMVHEFTHSMQYSTRGMRNSIYSGWIWESHGNFMASQYPMLRNDPHCSWHLAWNPHVYFGSTRNRYCNFQFWNYLKDKYGFEIVNDIFVKTDNIYGQDPLETLMKNNNWSPEQLGDEFGHFAMRNVNWDYIDRQDEFNRGATFRQAYGKNTDVSSPQKRNRLAKMEVQDLAQRKFVVSDYFAPQRYGYNLVRLIPDVGASKIRVSFYGVIQSKIADNAEYGKLAYEPGAWDWKDATVPDDPRSNWRWGVVAIGSNGASRMSPLLSGASGGLPFDVRSGDEIYLVVAAAPDIFHKIFWDQKYHTIYRFPWTIQLENAYPDGYQPGYQPGSANSGRRHSNGGGWVANSARVDASAYVAPGAYVLGGEVTGSARIEDYATVWNGKVSDNAIVGGLSQLDGGMTVYGNAQVRSIYGGNLSPNTRLGGTVKVYGDVEMHWSNQDVTRGAFTGVFGPEHINDATWGAYLTRQPIEVTIPVTRPRDDIVVNEPNTWVIRPQSQAQNNMALTHYRTAIRSNFEPNPQGNADYQWKKVDGLAGRCVSFESISNPGRFIRHTGYQAVLHQNDGSQLFREDASFCEQKQGAAVAFESVNYPGYFLHLDTSNEIWIRPRDNSAQFNERASFVLQQIG